MINNTKLLTIDFGALQTTATPLLPAGSTLGSIINRILVLFFPIAGIAVFFYLIYGGYQYMMSAGDPKAAQSAQQTITYAVIGFIVVFSAYFIVQAFGVALKLPAITNMF